MMSFVVMAALYASNFLIVTSNTTARYIGIGASLLVPSESLWQLASHHMQPLIVRDMGIGPRHGGMGGGLRAGHARRRLAPFPHARPLVPSA